MWEASLSRGADENAQFWRWLLTRMTGRDKWIPPQPPPRENSKENDDNDLEWSEGDQ